MAGDLFLEQGKHAEAVRAYTWALAVDELAPATVQDFAAALRGDGADDAAWMVLHWPRLQPAGARVPLRTWEEGAPGAAEAARLPAPGDTPAPFARELEEVGAFLDLFAEAAAACEEAGWGLSAHAVAADHNLIAPWLGRPPLEEPRRTRARIVEDGIDRGWAPAWSDAQWTTGADALHPFDPAWRPLGESGWTEFDLTGHEDRRVRELWYQDATNALWVGRDEAAIGTGEMERHSPHRNAVVFAEEWFDAGRYAITMQIEPATALVEGGLVFGWTRRDRNVRLGLSMRDHEYARGESEEYRLGGVGWSLDALYARRGAQDGAQGLPDGRDFFELTIEVDGPTADVFLDGKPQGSISTLDASAIHGRVGFWVTQGVMKVSQPRVRRLDRSAERPGARAVGNGLHPRRRGDQRWRWLVGRPVSGLPLAPSGTVVLWYPEQTEDKLAELEEGAWYDEVAEELNRLLDGMELEFPSQGVLVLVPESFPEADVVALREGFGEYVRGGFDVVRHDRPEAAEEELRTIAGWRRPLIAFVDPTGFLRYARREGRPTTRLPQPLRELLVEHQDHSRPGRAGAGD